MAVSSCLRAQRFVQVFTRINATKWSWIWLANYTNKCMFRFFKIWTVILPRLLGWLAFIFLAPLASLTHLLEIRSNWRQSCVIRVSWWISPHLVLSLFSCIYFFFFGFCSCSVSVLHGWVVVNIPLDACLCRQDVSTCPTLLYVATRVPSWTSSSVLITTTS